MGDTTVTVNVVTHTSMLSTQIQGQAESLAGLYQQLTLILAQAAQARQDLSEAERFRDAAERALADAQRDGADDSTITSLKQKKDAAQATVDRLIDSFDAIMEQVDKLLESIQEATNKLQDLQNRIPEAQRQDFAEAFTAYQSALEEAEQKARELAEAIKSNSDEQIALKRTELSNAITNAAVAQEALDTLLRSTGNTELADELLGITEVGITEVGTTPQELPPLEDGYDTDLSTSVGVSQSQSGLNVEVNVELTYIDNLPPDERQTLSGIANSIAQVVSGDRSPAGVQSRWADFIARVAISGNVDVNALVMWVLRQSYTETTEDLRFYAEKVKYYNDLKDSIRNELTAAREYLAQADVVGLESEDDLPGSGYSAAIVTTDPTIVDGAATVPTFEREDITTKAELETYIENLETQLNSVGDDAQLANVDLQNVLQKQQQTLQMLSNISKMLHDTAMSVIRKIGG